MTDPRIQTIRVVRGWLQESAEDRVMTLVEDPSFAEHITAALDSLAADMEAARERGAILADISAERDRQDRKWGGVPGRDRRDDHTYAAVLGEEFGEACKEWLERDTTKLRTELIQVAAVAVAWVEELDNGGALARLSAGKETG